MSFTSLLDTTCDFYIQGHTTNSIGEQVLTKTLSVSGVACRLDRLSADNMICKIKSKTIELVSIWKIKSMKIFY